MPIQTDRDKSKQTRYSGERHERTCLLIDMSIPTEIRNKKGKQRKNSQNTKILRLKSRNVGNENNNCPSGYWGFRACQELGNRKLLDKLINIEKICSLILFK